eukprot:1159443-Pelagomonas_calceolata.AAC.1
MTVGTVRSEKKKKRGRACLASNNPRSMNCCTKPNHGSTSEQKLASYANLAAVGRWNNGRRMQQPSAHILNVVRHFRARLKSV